MPAPLAKGLIIAASVLVAAGIAFYENPQVRQWVDQSRRKIAIALYSLGDELQPERSNSQSQRQSEEHRRRRREEIARRNRRELIRRAQEEGVAVDLDELARVGREVENEELGRTNTQRSNASRSFDELVGSDGRLHEQSTPQDEDDDPDLKAAIAASLADLEEQRRKEAAEIAEIATALEAGEAAQHLRRRGAGARGLAAGAAFGNPFADDDVQLLFDQELIDIEQDEAPHADADAARVSRESTETLAGAEVAAWSQLVDVSEPDPAISVPELPQVQRQPEMSQISSVPAISEPLDASYASFHSTATGPRAAEVEAAEEVHSTGTLTPTEDGFSTAASLAGSNADDVAVLASINGSLAGSVSGADQDGRSEAGFSEGGFSEVSAGAMTPSSWSDIGSDEGSEWNQGHGQGVAGH
ncbi:hypothetical protein H2201_002995 [Coniosporium apollinis]|uniref:Uncharacterized protein n=1 Tax=Coniosporium apollinis TaxID=61459 RepID=A0ABQ9P0P5_9PEZI|nr:hypothetical protein H2201_002995 [Coniosporium apollinis]